MERNKRVALMGVLLSVCLTNAPGGVKGASPAPDPVQFSAPTFVDPPKTLSGDSGDGRCPDSSKKCFKDVDDLLGGRTHLLRSDDLVLGSRSGRGLLQTKDSNITSNASQTLTDGTNRYSWPAVVGARLFNTGSDVAVTLVLDRSANLLQWRLDSSTALIGSGTVGMNVSLDEDPGHLAVVAADFTGDGFDEIVVFPKGPFSRGSGAVIVGTAVDPQYPSQGLKFGPLGPYLLDVSPFSITKVDVLGQPRVFVAGPASRFRSGCGANGAGLQFESYTIDPQSLALSSQGTFPANIPEGNTACLHSVDLTAGRFSTATHDQLLVTYGMEGGNVKVLPFDLTAQGLAVQKPIYDTGIIIGGGHANSRGGRFDWSSPVDQAALLIANNLGDANNNTVRILSFDPNFNATAGKSFAANIPGDCASDMVVGNFDRQQANPGTPPPTTITNPNLQIAAAFSDCGNRLDVRILDVDPAKQFEISTHSSWIQDLDSSAFQATLAAADLQGRSLRVGLPTKVTIDNRSQPMVALAAPPMHVDAVIPLAGGTQRPFNVTGVPAGFYAKFSLTDNDDNKSNTTDSTTWSWGSKETVGAKGEIGSCELGDCLDFGYQATAQQALDGSSATLTGNFSTFTDSFNFTTGFADKIYYKDETLTIYVYPVLGRAVPCDPKDPTCTAGQTVPLVINMAGPDTQNTTITDGSTLTWYQPPWIPGNILSYPGNVTQLAADAFSDPKDFQTLSDPIRWFTGDGSDNASSTWTNGSSSGSTSSFNQNYSFDLDISVSGKVGVGGLDTLSANAGLDLSGSFGFSHLTDSSTTLTKTQGIEFDRTATFEDTDYGYYVSPYLFGQAQPGGVVDNKPLSTDVKTFGALRTGHVVDIPSSGCCGFWDAWYGKAPDVALNQPVHWAVKTLASDPGDGSCRIFNSGSSDFNCVQLSERLPNNQPTDIWTDEFHKMRGLFVTGPQGQGPQLQTATTGDQLVLQARVYNLSLASLPAGAVVHVRFMGMPWNAAVHPQQPAGASFLIGEQTIAGDQLPPFNSDTSHPNWALVPQPFDTSGTHCGGQSCDNQDLVFWVVVWMENGGTLGSELPEHGLASIPADGEDFLAVAGREQPYSNNLGFYDQVFHIFAKTPPLQAPTPSGGEIGAQLTEVGAASYALERGERTVVAAKVQTGSHDLNAGLKVAFYDGDPQSGGTLIGLQQLPHLRANSTYDFRVGFRSDVCGQHDIYIVPGANTRHEHAAKLQPIAVNGGDCGVVPPCAADVTAQVSLTRGGYRRDSATGRFVQQLTLTNPGPASIAGPVALALDGVSGNATLFSPSGTTTCASPTSPFVSLDVGTDNSLGAGETASVVLEFTNPTNAGITYAPRVLAGTNR